VNGIVELSVEVINPELIEVAKNHVLGAIRNESHPIFFCLAVMFLEVCPALLQFNNDPRFPNKICEASGARLLFDRIFASRPSLEYASIAERLE
jgi:hypothetical protein